MGSDLLQAAQSYAAYGWHIVPLRPGDKQPAVANGVKAATDDQDQILAWWTENPDYNIGLACGVSGVVAIDVDDPAGLAEIEQRHGQLPETATVRTGKGEHYLYRTPEALFPNSASKLARGVDTRGEGGYVVLPPSLHPNGKTYEWVSKGTPAELPAWVPEELSRTKAPAAETPTSSSAYGQAVLSGEISKLVMATEGQRNATLFQCAVRIFELVKAHHIDKGEAVDSLERAARGIGLDHDETRRTLESAWQRAEARPPEPLEEVPEEHHESADRQFLTLTDLRRIPAPQWLIPNVLPEGMTVLYGQRNQGKTFMALDWALTLASYGENVVYCAGEGASGLSSRVDAWVLKHPELDPSGHFLIRAYQFFPRLLRDGSVGKLLFGFQELEKRRQVPRLIVIDTWRRALAGETTSSDETATKAIDVLDTLRDRWGTSSLILHHPKKASKDDRNPSEAGSGALGDNADFVCKLSVDDEQNRRLLNEKAKDFEEQHPLGFQLRPFGQSLVVSPSVSEQMGSTHVF